MTVLLKRRNNAVILRIKKTRKRVRKGNKKYIQGQAGKEPIPVRGALHALSFQQQVSPTPESPTPTTSHPNTLNKNVHETGMIYAVGRKQKYQQRNGLFPTHPPSTVPRLSCIFSSATCPRRPPRPLPPTFPRCFPQVGWLTAPLTHGLPLPTPERKLRGFLSLSFSGPQAPCTSEAFQKYLRSKLGKPPKGGLGGPYLHINCRGNQGRYFFLHPELQAGTGTSTRQTTQCGRRDSPGEQGCSARALEGCHVGA